MRGKESTITLWDVDQFLNEISENHKQQFIEDKLLGLILKSQALDNKWLVKIILKNMYLNYNKKRLLFSYNPKASQIYDKYNNLSKVCIICDNNKWEDEADIIGENGQGQHAKFKIDVFQSIRPMLCKRFDIQKLSELVENDVYLDTKYDGERFQLHFKDGVYKYFSRKGHDYTPMFGQTSNEGNLSQFLHSQFKIPISSLILDGEMMKCRKDDGTFQNKGENEADVKKLKMDSPLRPCFFVYDVLYLNGVSQLEKPFADRRNLLNNLINNREGVIKKCIPVSIRDVDHVLSSLNAAFDRGEEGVILKEASSTYKTGDRNGGWYKIKPDYIEGVCSDFDMVSSI